MTLSLAEGLPFAGGDPATVIAQAAEAEEVVTPVQITSVKKSGSSSLKIKWSNAGGVSYKLYRSLHENYGYKCIKTIKASDKKTLSYTDKVTKGTQYFYRLVTIKGGVKSEPSDSVCGFLATGGKRTVVKTNLVRNDNEQLLGSYVKDGLLNEVFLFGRVDYTNENSKKIIIRTYNKKNYAKKMKVKSTKTIKLNQFKKSELEFGGFYHANDGSNFILVGKDHDKTDKTKTYIKL